MIKLYRDDGSYMHVTLIDYPTDEKLYAYKGQDISMAGHVTHADGVINIQQFCNMMQLNYTKIEVDLIGIHNYLNLIRIALSTQPADGVVAIVHEKETVGHVIYDFTTNKLIFCPVATTIYIDAPVEY